MKEAIYGFKKEENTVIPALINCYRRETERIVVAEISGEIYKILSAGLTEDEHLAKATEDLKSYAEQMNCHFLLLTWKESEEERLYFYSDTKKVRALEFLDYLISEFGLVRGNAGLAGGRISSAILKVKMAALDITETTEYFLKMAASYFDDCDWIDAAEYGKQNADDIPNRTRYVKKRIPWAYVRSVDIVSEGEQFAIKSLENESGITLTANEDTYIMVGCRGESYDMKRERFERSYEATDEPLDIFERMLDFLPEAEIVATGDFIGLDEMAHLCYPKKGAGIYAIKINKRTKVFPVNGDDEYYLGRPGDYLAVRPEDFSDVYIIQGEIFEQTYEEAEGE